MTISHFRRTHSTLIPEPEPLSPGNACEFTSNPQPGNGLSDYIEQSTSESTSAVASVRLRSKASVVNTSLQPPPSQSEPTTMPLTVTATATNRGQCRLNTWGKSLTQSRDTQIVFPTASTSHSKSWRILTLFSGPANTQHGIDRSLIALGPHEVCMVDIVNAETYPKRSMCRPYVGTLASEYIIFRCYTYGTGMLKFLPARRHALSARDSGPRPLRSVAEPMGLKKPDPPFTSAELETMKIGNCFSRRSLLFAKAAKSADIPVALEAPRVVYADQVSMYMFPEAQDLMDLGAFTVDPDQCRFSAHSTKPTRFSCTTSIARHTSRIGLEVFGTYLQP